MKSKSFVLASILAISTAAFAQTPPAGAPGAPGAPNAERAAGGHHGMNAGKPITRAEALVKAGEHFDLVDTNKDGVLDEAERKLAHEKMRAMHQMHEQQKNLKAGDVAAPMPAPARK